MIKAICCLILLVFGCVLHFFSLIIIIIIKCIYMKASLFHCFTAEGMKQSYSEGINGSECLTVFRGGSGRGFPFFPRTGTSASPYPYMARSDFRQELSAESVHKSAG